MPNEPIREVVVNGNSYPIEADTSSIEAQLTAEDNLKFRFATDGDGNYGYRGADDSFVPFKSGAELVGTYSSNTTVNVSSYGANSASQFVLVPYQSKTVTATCRTYVQAQFYGIHADGIYTNGVLSLSNNRLTVTLPTVKVSLAAAESPVAESAIPCKLYYIG